MEKMPLSNPNSINFESIYRKVPANILSRAFSCENKSKTLTLLGFCHKKIGNTKKAINYFEKAILADKTNFSAFYQLGLCALKENKNCVALNSFVNAVQLNPDNIPAILNLGFAHELCDEEDMAFMVYQRLIETAPDYTPAYLYKAELFIKMSRYLDAIELLTTALKYSPNSQNLYAQLALCYKMLGKTTAAYRIYKKILNLNASNEITVNAIKEMRQIRNNNSEKISALKVCV